jgi:glycosyltransferase involved in cell wall biosynthesis
MKILHVINSLDIGGAEQMLLKLIKAKSFAEDEIIVVTLLDEGSLAGRIRSLGCEVIPLKIRKNPASWLSLYCLIKIIKDFEPQIIQSWLYHSDLVAGILGRIAGVPVIWGVRQSNLSQEHNKLTTRIVIFACALLSRFLPSQIITNSSNACRAHIRAGYCCKFTVIPNGFDTEIFSPDSNAFKELRAELAIPTNSIVVGMVGRFDSQKNHAGFFEVASYVHNEMPNVHFCLAGAGINSTNLKLRKMSDAADIPASLLHLLGAREDVAYLMAGFDILSLPSKGESFPNVVGEAMASQTPCVVTDVGDCAQIVGNTGRVVTTGDMKQFANAIIEMLSMSSDARNQIGRQARQRILKNYSLDYVASQFREIYLTTIAQKL